MAQRVTPYGARFSVSDSQVGARLEAFGTGVVRSAAVRERFSGHRWRLLHLVPVDEWDEGKEQYVTRSGEAVVYDYDRNQAYRISGETAAGARLEMVEESGQPLPSAEEWDEAIDLVRESAEWGPLLKSGAVEAYRPMPPMLEGPAGERVQRTLYVGLASKPRKFNRMVSVNLVTREVSRRPVVPANSRVDAMMCGVPEVGCRTPSRGTPGALSLEWPATNPVWRMDVTRPSSSSGTNGSGIEIRNVQYRGRRVLRQGHMPILSVEYELNRCGPYRDWLFQEMCFQAQGEDIPGTQGFRWCTAPPQSILDSGRDGGNYVGVAIWESPDGFLRLISQMRAGWYRYVMSWDFHLDGRIMPRFGFDGVNNSCVCKKHNHHALWRFDFDILNTRNSVEQLMGSRWVRVPREQVRFRKSDGSPRFRVRDSRTSVGYEIIPGAEDGIGTEFSGADYLLLRSSTRQIDDGIRLVGGDVQPTIKRFANNSGLVAADLVVWYGAHFLHSVAEDPMKDGASHHVVGPTLQPYNWPE